MSKQTISAKTVGITYDKRQDTVKEILNHATANHRKTWCSLERETDNEHDPNAIAVILHTYRMKGQVGYLSKELAKELAPIIDASDEEHPVFVDSFKASHGGPRDIWGIALELSYEQ